MTDRLRAAAQAALEALINGKNVRAGEGGTKHQPTMEDAAIKQLRAALAEPTCKQDLQVAEQDAEPFIWYADDTGETWTSEAVAEGWAPTDLRPLYAAPPRREWVSLTEQEIWDSVKHGVVGGIGMPSKAVAVARAIEAALKERNT